ncbi:hypothetical protein [Edaphobacter dinghuensis]|uniref:Uncharacterized protein n=1 Tax=Edaphobacter dinghuensis TaxID=1560005 RepID=A0A917HJ85_9BACT|nr:hypothetical protein [Edaphobacter dinghuensis]GGG80440.1 hypothetical protein GCM10011585_24810 [Edaphobacter dinghuensis]
MTNLTRPLLLAALILAVLPAQSQSGNEGRIHSDFRREGEQLQSCKTFNFGSLANCAETLVTGQPMHIAVGSLAPQNGTAAGLAFVEHKDYANEWRLNWDLDAVGSGNGSWRAGAYMKAFRQPGGKIIVVAGPSKNTNPLYRTAPLFNLYAETTSLNRIYFYGLGPNTLPADRSAFGLTQTIAGASAILPLAGKTGISLVGELNGRVPQLRSNNGESSPSIAILYNESTAPGLTRQPAFLQAGEGLRIRPSLFRDTLRLNYLLQFQQFVALSDSHYSFRRWNADFGHEFPLYRNVRLTAANDQNGPDSCSTSSSTTACPHISLTQNLEGSIAVRLFMTGSIANAGSVVPFYFDPTIGGSDLNGQPILASYPDYRFRAPNLLLLRETFEHSLGKLPAGFLFSIDEAKVGMNRDDISFDHLRHTFTAGLTVHAGGLPVVYLLFSWGGNEGHHTTASISNTLLGASARPSLF